MTGRFDSYRRMTIVSSTVVGELPLSVGLCHVVIELEMLRTRSGCPTRLPSLLGGPVTSKFV